MLAAWNSIFQFDGKSSIKTWLFSIARHKISDYYRKKPHTNMLNIDDCLEISDYEDANAGIDVWEGAQKLLDTLSSPQLWLVKLVFGAGLRYSEISQLTGVPEGTIKSRMAAIRSKLRKMLGDDLNE